MPRLLGKYDWSEGEVGYVRVADPETLVNRGKVVSEELEKAFNNSILFSAL